MSLQVGERGSLIGLNVAFPKINEGVVDDLVHCPVIGLRIIALYFFRSRCSRNVVLNVTLNVVVLLEFFLFRFQEWQYVQLCLLCIFSNDCCFKTGNIGLKVSNIDVRHDHIGGNKGTQQRAHWVKCLCKIQPHRGRFFRSHRQNKRVGGCFQKRKTKRQNIDRKNEQPEIDATGGRN